jgi:exodeoxyribonuclease VII small subunit
MAEKKPDFEQASSRLTEIIRALERGDTPLEGAVKLFEEGAKLAVYCETLLVKAEQRVLKLTRSGDTVTEQEFEATE